MQPNNAASNMIGNYICHNVYEYCLSVSYRFNLYDWWSIRGIASHFHNTCRTIRENMYNQDINILNQLNQGIKSLIQGAIKHQG